MTGPGVVWMRAASALAPALTAKQARPGSARGARADRGRRRRLRRPARPPPELAPQRPTAFRRRAVDPVGQGHRSAADHGHEAAAATRRAGRLPGAAVPARLHPTGDRLTAFNAAVPPRHSAGRLVLSSVCSTGAFRPPAFAFCGSSTPTSSTSSRRGRPCSKIRSWRALAERPGRVAARAPRRVGEHGPARRRQGAQRHRTQRLHDRRPHLGRGFGAVVSAAGQRRHRGRIALLPAAAAAHRSGAQPLLRADPPPHERHGRPADGRAGAPAAALPGGHLPPRVAGTRSPGARLSARVQRSTRFNVLDFSRLSSIGGSATGFYDGVHLRPPTTRLVVDAVLRALPHAFAAPKVG